MDGVRAIGAAHVARESADLHVALGSAARDALCGAFDGAHQSIDAAFHSVNDPQVIASLKAAAARDVAVTVHVEGRPSRFGRAPDTGRHHVAGSGRWLDDLRRALGPAVRLVVEDDPEVQLHAKAAVVDRSCALIATANPTISGFDSPGEVLVSDDRPADVAAVEAFIAGHAAAAGGRVVTGPGALARPRLSQLLTARDDLRIATEDLSDPEVVSSLVSRAAAGSHDEVLIEANATTRPSWTQREVLGRLRSAGVDVRTPAAGYMHEKYIDAGELVYVGSANLTHNGLDEAKEVGVVATASSFGAGAAALRRDFDRMWSGAVPA